MRLTFQCDVASSWLKVKDGFTVDLFKQLKPPFIQLEVLRFDGCCTGDEVHVEINSLGMTQKWVSHITSHSQQTGEWAFIDEGHQLPWPLKSWKHHHKVLNLDDKSSKIVDDIHYECEQAWMSVLMYPLLWFSFAVRPIRYREYFRG